MNEEIIKNHLDLLIGRKLDNLNLACEMMMFIFGDISVHSQCFTRILHKDRILLTTLDYQNWDEITDTNNDEWHNLSQHKNIIVNNKVIKAEFTPTQDVFIQLENDICIQMFLSNGAPHYVEDCEQWRIFNNNVGTPHVVIYSDHIRIPE